MNAKDFERFLSRNPYYFPYFGRYGFLLSPTLGCNSPIISPTLGYYVPYFGI
jgi:hypothetical protein